VMARVTGFPGIVRTFGFDERADVRAADVRELGLAGMKANLRTPVGSAALHVPLLGRGNLANVLAAIAVALRFDVSLHEIVGRAAALTPAAHRGEVLRLRDGLVVLDDSYNSNPSALLRALAVVAAEAGHARKVAVIGEMLELGASSAALHRECGRAAADAGLTALVAVGREPARALADAAKEAGLPSAAVTYVEDSRAAAEIVLPLLRPGDLLFVKGSRGVRTDLVVDRVKEAWS
jgi:UDP-N-acetylmuramoyl-tripeptide--D-alanyl-D-alanine ligase